MKLNQAVSNNTILFFNFCITLINEKIGIERQKGRALQRASLQTALHRSFLVSNFIQRVLNNRKENTLGRLGELKGWFLPQI